MSILLYYIYYYIYILPILTQYSIIGSVFLQTVKVNSWNTSFKTEISGGFILCVYKCIDIYTFFFLYTYDPLYAWTDVLGELVVSAPLDVFLHVLPTSRHEEFRGHIRQCHSAALALHLRTSLMTYAHSVLAQMSK